MKQKQENVNLVRKIAWSFHKTTGIEWEELFLQASYLYCKALQTYEPSKGKLSSYCWLLITSEMTTFVSEEKKRVEILDPIEAAVYKPTPTYDPFMDTLQDESKQVVGLILKHMDKLDSTLLLESLIETYDCSNSDKTKKTLKQTINEVRFSIKEQIHQILSKEGLSDNQIWESFLDFEIACTNSN